MNKFLINKTSIEGLVTIEPTLFGDERGFFMESYSKRDFEQLGLCEEFVQDNHSKSKRGVLRGLHFQSSNCQGKLIRVVAGSVYDVAVDLRIESDTFGKWFGVVLSATNKQQLYVPPRFAHGFLTLEDNTELLYKCTDYYSSEHDMGLLWSDEHIGIDWRLNEFNLNITDIILSEKDSCLPKINQIEWSEISFANSHIV